MAAMTAQLLADQLGRDFPAFRYQEAPTFSWSPTTHTITYQAEADAGHLLHELAHAILEHHTYQRDITLIDMERQAWEYAAATLAPRYGISLTMDDDIVQDALDSYRHWLHARSTCPDCSAVGIEIRKQHYRCLHCNSEWRVNDARNCQLRRRRKK
mgnify:FL=1